MAAWHSLARRLQRQRRRPRRNAAARDSRIRGGDGAPLAADADRQRRFAALVCGRTAVVQRKEATRGGSAGALRLPRRQSTSRSGAPLAPYSGAAPPPPPPAAPPTVRAAPSVRTSGRRMPGASGVAADGRGSAMSPSRSTIQRLMERPARPFNKIDDNGVRVALEKHVARHRRRRVEIETTWLRHGRRERHVRLMPRRAVRLISTAASSPDRSTTRRGAPPATCLSLIATQLHRKSSLNDAQTVGTAAAEEHNVRLAQSPMLVVEGVRRSFIIALLVLRRLLSRPSLYTSLSKFREGASRELHEDTCRSF